MFCSKCGSEISEGSMFCDECGENVEYVREKKVTSIDLIRKADLSTKVKSAEGKINQ